MIDPYGALRVGGGLAGAQGVSVSRFELAKKGGGGGKSLVGSMKGRGE